jgi:UDP-GlcNAc:undecaprenyl-phosphate GlcNAc-1-phosphate transferase
MLTLVLSFLMSFSLVYALLPATIRVAKDKGLVARPIARSSHKTLMPCVGGIPIFIGVIFTTLLLTPYDQWAQLQYILSAMVIVFLVGAKDDIEQLSAWHKMVGLLVAISILITRGEVRLESMYGLLGFSGELPYWVSLLVSAFTLLVITNAFNLIDGINGLAGTVGTICSLTFGIWFFMAGSFYLGIISMTTAGGLIAFLRFNITPAKTFMGDTGALVVGLLLGVMSIEFIDLCATANLPAKFRFMNPVAVAVGILIIPLFDTLRVFITRMLHGRSPLQPDRRHIHHLLIDSGHSHMEATAILAMANILFISLVFVLDSLVGLHYLLGILIGVALLLTFFLYRSVRVGRGGVSKPKSLTPSAEEISVKQAV